MINLTIDTRNKRICLDDNFASLFISSNNFNQYNFNDFLIDIISNTKEISKEINSIIDIVTKEYKNTSKSRIFIDERNLLSISPVFQDIEEQANNYAQEFVDKRINAINNFNGYIKRYTEDYNVYQEHINALTIDYEDIFEFISNIEDKYLSKFPKKLLDLKNKIELLEEKLIQLNSKEINTELDNLYEEYHNYIKQFYKEDYQIFLDRILKTYQKEMEICKKDINNTLVEVSKIKLELKTMYFDKFIFFLEKINRTVSYLEYQVKALNCIGFDDDDLIHWKSLTREQRLILSEIYVNPWHLHFELPKSKIFYAIEENKNITFLDNYATKLISENKKEPFYNICNSVLTKNIFELHQYNCENIIDILNVLLYQYKLSNIKINICSNCKKYFVPSNRTDEVYCDRISPQNSKKTCKQYGAKKTYRDKINSDNVKKAHFNTSQFFRMKIKRAKTEREIYLLSQKFDKYKLNYEKQKDKYKKKKISEKDFIEWINKQKELKKANKEAEQ